MMYLTLYLCFPSISQRESVHEVQDQDGNARGRFPRHSSGARTGQHCRIQSRRIGLRLRWLPHAVWSARNEFQHEWRHQNSPFHHWLVCRCLGLYDVQCGRVPGNPPQGTGEPKTSCAAHVVAGQRGSAGVIVEPTNSTTLVSALTRYHLWKNVLIVALITHSLYIHFMIYLLLEAPGLLRKACVYRTLSALLETSVLSSSSSIVVHRGLTQGKKEYTLYTKKSTISFLAARDKVLPVLSTLVLGYLPRTDVAGSECSTKTEPLY